MAETLANKFKDNLEAIERLRNRGRELKEKLTHEGLREVEESELARELARISSAICALNESRNAVYDEVDVAGKAAAEKAAAEKAAAAAGETPPPSG